MNGEYFDTYNTGNDDTSFIDTLLSKNMKKKVIIHMNNSSSTDEINGILEEIGKDYLILSDPTSGNYHVILPIYINYITFEEEIKS